MYGIDLRKIMQTPEATGALTPVKENARLWDLVDQMRALLDTEEGGVPPEEEQAFALSVREALLASRDKVDAYHGILGQTMMSATVADAVADHHAEQSRAMRDRASRLRGVAERIKNYVLDAVRTLGADPKSKTGAYRKLEGTCCTFQANKVGASCEVFDAELIPLKYKSVTISTNISGELWLRPCRLCSDLRGRAPDPSAIECPTCGYSGLAMPDLGRGMFRPEWSIDKKALLADLKQTCEPCGGSGCFQVIHFDKAATLEPCKDCAGKGTKRIPGARLLDGKLSLVVK